LLFLCWASNPTILWLNGNSAGALPGPIWRLDRVLLPVTDELARGMLLVPRHVPNVDRFWQEYQTEDVTEPRDLVCNGWFVHTQILVACGAICGVFFRVR
jgi:hypothetical protein